MTQRNRAWPAFIGILACVLASACSEEEGNQGDAGMAGAGGSGGAVDWPAVADFAAPGPFATDLVMEGPDCHIHKPINLGEDGRRHPVIVWGNGTAASPPIYQAALAHWASHGFIVAAAATSNAGTGVEMLACLDYLVAEDTRVGSPFEGNVDAGLVGASGHSQGGGGALMAGADSRVTVTAPVQPYTAQGFGGFDQASIAQQKGPMFLQSGAEDTIATINPNQQRVWDGVSVPTFWGVLAGADHIGSVIGDLGGYRGPTTAWFRAHLMDDETARTMFYGADCDLCSDAMWTVMRKDIE